MKVNQNQNQIESFQYFSNFQTVSKISRFSDIARSQKMTKNSQLFQFLIFERSNNLILKVPLIFYIPKKCGFQQKSGFIHNICGL